MKKILALSFTVVAVGLLNVGCSAHASVHGTNATKLDNSRQVAYIGNPSK